MALPAFAAVWLAGLVTAHVWYAFLPARMLAPLAQALAGPYDRSGCSATWLGTLRGALTAVMLLGSAWGWGRRGSSEPVLAVGLGLLALGLGTFGLGVTGLLHAAVLLPVIAGGVLLLPWSAARFPGRPRDRRTWFGAAALALVVALPLGPALAPEAGWDALTYHLRVPSVYLGAGRIHAIPYSLWSFYPFLSEMWFTLARLFGGDPGAKLVNFCFLPLCGWALVRAGRDCGLPAGAGWIAALLFTALPVAAAVSSQTYNDLEPAFFGLVGVWAAVRGGPRGRVLSAAFGGAALGCKYTGAWGLLVSAGVWILDVRRLRSGRPGAFALPAGIALLTVMPWPARDWLWTGNPVYPLAPNGFPATGWNPYFSPAEAARIVPVGGGAGLGARLADLIRFPFDLSWRIRGIGVPLSPLLTGLLPAWWLLGRRDRPLTVFAVAGLLSCVLWVLLQAGEGRYLLPAAALLALPAAAGAAALAGRGAGWAAVTAVCLSAALAAQTAGWIGYVSGTYFPWRVAAGLERRETYLGRALLPNYEFYPMAAQVNARLPARARILLFSDITSYYIERDVVFDTQQVTPPIALRLARSCATPAALRRRLRQLGLEVVLHSSVRLMAFEHDCHCLALAPAARACFTAFWRRYAVLEFELGSLKCFRLKSEREASSSRPGPFVAWPGLQEAVLAESEAARLSGDLKGARAAVRRLMTQAPELAEGPLRMAELDARERRLGEAERHLAAARRLGADSGSYWMLKAAVKGLERDRPGAYAAAKEGVARWPAPQVWASYMAHAFNAGDIAEARRARAQALRLAPFDPEVRRVAALLPP